MYYSRTFKIVFAVVCLFTALALVNCVLHVTVAAMVLYEGNFHAMHDLLPAPEAATIVRTSVNFLLWTALPLVFSNVCWIALFLFRRSRTLPNDRSA